MHVTVSSGALIKALGIVNNWPAQARGMMKWLDKMAVLLEPTEEEKTAMRWTEQGGQVMYVSDVPMEREIPDADAARLKEMLEPNANATWRRTEARWLKEWMEALGGEDE